MVKICGVLIKRIMVPTELIKKNIWLSDIIVYCLHQELSEELKSKYQFLSKMKITEEIADLLSLNIRTIGRCEKRLRDINLLPI